MRRLTLSVLFLSLAVGLAACGSGAPNAGKGSTSTSLSTPGSTTTTYTSSPPGTTSAPTTSGSTTTAASGTATKIPAVSAATNVQVEPVISPGSPPPPSKLLTKDLVVGTGATAGPSSRVVVKYVGADYTTGQDFTSGTWTDNKATTFALSTVVPGFKQGIEGMKVGGRREIVIPPSLGYGKNGSGSVIQPNETLVFVVDLTGLK